MADSDVGWGFAVLGIVLLVAHGPSSPGTATSTGPASSGVPASTQIGSEIGRTVSMNSVRVDAVPADEGFWVDSDTGRVWVQIETSTESPYTVRAGERVSFTGTVVPNGSNFPTVIGLTAAEGAVDLRAQGAHISIGVNALKFVTGP